LTIKVFLDDSYIREIKARIAGISKFNDRWRVLLDRTIFHPTAGGQPNDTGFIVGANGKLVVEDVIEDESGNILHFGQLEGSLEVGEEVSCVINWDRRYRLMRMHTSAHILIGAVREYFKSPVKCVSAGKDVRKGRLDFEAKITREMLPSIEEIANRVVDEDRRVLIKYMSPSEAEQYIRRFGESLELYLRKYGLPERIRVVEIEDWFATACGGTHVRRTSEIGRIKLLKRASKGRGIVRIEYTVEP